MTGAFFHSLTDRLRRSRPFGMARALRDCLRPGRRAADAKDRRVVSLSPGQPPQGRALVSYIIDPFLLQPGQAPPNSHTYYWETQQIVRTFLDLGYGVDVISWRNTTFAPQQDYAFFVDVRHNLERLAPLLNPECIKIFHSDTAHMLFHNAAESRRLLALQQRRGVTLRPRRFEMPNLAIEHADYAIIKGNEFTLGTYRYAGKPLYPIWGTSVVEYPWPGHKDFAASRKHYLFLSSSGMVHKGLDLVLEAFAGLPDHELTVCAPVGRETAFEDAFRKELYQTPNIHTHGWVDVSSAEFVEIAGRCVGLIYPSCSEGQSGAVITCLHAGLIPLVSYESGVDVAANFGRILPDCSVAQIKAAVRGLSDLPADALAQMARRAWEQARAHYTRDLFAQTFRDAITSISAAHAQHGARAQATDWRLI